MVELGANHDGNYFSLVLTDSLMFNAQEFTYKMPALYKSSGNIQLHFSVLSALIIRRDEKTHLYRERKFLVPVRFAVLNIFIFIWTTLNLKFSRPFSYFVFYYCWERERRTCPAANVWHMEWAVNVTPQTTERRIFFHVLNQHDINKCISAFCGFKTWKVRICTVQITFKTETFGSHSQNGYGAQPFHPSFLMNGDYTVNPKVCLK
jgi:hypothetical protein